MRLVTRPLGNICSRLVSNSNKIFTTRNGHFYMRENAIQAIIRHQKLSARLDSPTDDCDIASVSFLNLSKQICWGIKPTPWSGGSFWNISLVYKFVISYIYSLVCNGIHFIPSQTNVRLGFCNKINTLWSGHLFLKCFSWLPFSTKASWRPAISHDDICKYSKRGERAIYIVQRTLSFTYLVWLFLSKWYHWLCKDWFSMLSWSWRGRFWDGSLSSHRWNVYLAHLRFRSSVVGQMLF